MHFLLRTAPQGLRHYLRHALHRHRVQRLSGMPGWMLASVIALLIALLYLTILYEPLRNRDELPYYHPPGMPPAISKLH
ncbi:MAG TPA: hypothetical protein PKM88_12345 [bacterium]|nr:hypothetical protein [bacterium]